MDVADQYGAPILCGIPLVTGADLLAQFEYLGFGGEMRVLTNGQAWAVPRYDNLGTDANLYWLTL